MGIYVGGIVIMTTVEDIVLFLLGKGSQAVVFPRRECPSPPSIATLGYMRCIDGDLSNASSASSASSTW